MARRPGNVMDSRREALLKALAEGHTRKAAAHIAGIHQDTVRDWETEGTDFSDRIREAELAGVALAERTLVKAMTDDPKYALAYLERRSRSDWGRNVAVENSGELAVRVIREGDA